MRALRPNKWLVLGAAGLGFFLVNFDGGIIGVMLPTLQKVFHAEFNQVQWVWLAGLLTIIVTLAVAGRLGDMIGKRPMFAAGGAMYALGSLLITIAPSIGLVAVCRVVQALGVTIFLALGAAVVTENFEERQRGLALGVFNLLGLVGILAGPILAGILIQSFAWNTVFAVGIGLALLVIAATFLFIPPSEQTRSGTFDFAGSAALFICLGALLSALTIGQDLGFSSPTVLALLALSVAALAVFVWVERKVAEPTIDLRFFSNSTFTLNLVLLFLGMIALSGYGFLMPFYLQNVLGLSTMQMGLLLALIFGLVMAVTAPIGGSLSDRFGTWPITLAGLALLGIGTLAGSTLTAGSSQGEFVLRFLPIGAGIGLLITPTSSAVMGALPRERLGMGSSLLSITINTAQTMGIAVLGTFWSARVAGLLGSAPAGGASAAPPAIQVAALRETFFLAAVLIGLGLLLNLWGLIRRRGSAKAPAAAKA